MISLKEFEQALDTGKLEMHLSMFSFEITPCKEWVKVERATKTYLRGKNKQYFSLKVKYDNRKIVVEPDDLLDDVFPQNFRIIN